MQTITLWWYKLFSFQTANRKTILKKKEMLDIMAVTKETEQNSLHLFKIQFSMNLLKVHRICSSPCKCHL